jgi:hypothetical protein
VCLGTAPFGREGKHGWEALNWSGFRLALVHIGLISRNGSRFLCRTGGSTFLLPDPGSLFIAQHIDLLSSYVHDHNWTVNCWVVLGVLVVFWLW